MLGFMAVATFEGIWDGDDYEPQRFFLTIPMRTSEVSSSIVSTCIPSDAFRTDGTSCTSSLWLSASLRAPLVATEPRDAQPGLQ